MKSSIYLPGLLAACIGLVTAAIAMPASANLSETKRWEFKVLLDDREIGYHEFKVDRNGSSRRVESRASFDVKILFINAYRYRHQNVENWNDDCLTDIDAATDANGEKFAVTGNRDENGFSLRTGNSEASLPQCVMSFAYWNPELLKASRLVNTQTGEYENVEISFDGSDAIEVDGRVVPADRYLIQLDEGPITVWYAKKVRRWLALESVAKGGRILRYQPVSLPTPANATMAKSSNDGAASNDA